MLFILYKYLTGINRGLLYLFAIVLLNLTPAPVYSQQINSDCRKNQRDATNIAYIVKRCFSENQLLQLRSAIIQRKPELNSDEKETVDTFNLLFGIDYSALNYLYDIASQKTDDPEELAKNFAEKLKFHWALIEKINARTFEDAFSDTWRDVLRQVEEGQYTEAERSILALRDERLLYSVGQSESQSQTYQPERLADVEAMIGQIALIQSQYSIAAVRFRTAAELITDNGAKSAEYLQASAESLYLQSGENWSAEGLRQSIEIYRQVLKETPRQDAPEFWAETQHKLGRVFLRLGTGERSVSALKDAVSAFQAALDVRSQTRDPDRWAEAQADLAAALFRLGASQKSTENLLNSVAAYRLALSKIDSSTAPEKWNTWQNGLGAALWSLGNKEKETVNYLEDAVTAFKDALKGLDAERNPRDLGATQNNLGAALFALAERMPGEKHLNQAIEAFKASLSAYQEASALYFVVGIRKNLASAETMLRERQRK